MVAVSLEFTGESKRTLAALERETPITFRAALAGAATRVQNRLRKVMRVAGGVYGVPKFAPRSEMTLLMRPGSKPGGILADKGNILKWRKGDGQMIGWVDRLAAWASGIQGASRYEFQDWQKSMLHRNYPALKAFKIPEYYERPARMVIDPFAEHVSGEFAELVRERYEVLCARRLKRGLEIG